ncbi:MAG: hypothetical protein JEZ06_21740 [Anaerolineaceae bacterium]|nr:hypothetical protein [Anaerolineaceae bacterium]
MSKKLRNLTLFSGMIFGFLSVYIGWFRKKNIRWGASQNEVSKPLPGDQLISKTRLRSTRAITINQTPDKIWPWLIQIGFQRAGWYSYDTLEKLAGVAEFVDGHSAMRIIPALQNIQPGDTIQAGPEPYISFLVETLDEPSAFVLSSYLNPISGLTLERGIKTQGPRAFGIWSFNIQPKNAHQSRLIVRFQMDYEPGWLSLLMFPVLEPAVFIMEQKMLRGIKKRAENYS